MWRISSDESRKMVQLYKTVKTLLIFGEKKACNHGQGTRLLHGSGCIGEGYSFRVVAWLSIHVVENVA